MMEEIICYAILYLVEAVIAWLYFEYLFERKHNVYVTLSMFLGGYVLCFLIYEFNITWANTISFFVINLILAAICYCCGVKTAILHAAFLSFIMTISEIAIVLLIGLFGYEFDAYKYSFNIMLLLVILSKLLYMALAMLSARLFKPHKKSNEEPKLMILFCILPLISMVTSIFVAYLGLNTELTKSAEIMILITFIALLTVNLLFFLIYNYIQYTNHENTMLQISIRKDEADTAYYKALYEQAENQKILIHDIKKHLNMIGSLAEKANNTEIKNYVADVVCLSEVNQKKKFSDNPILNIILQQYSQKCDEVGISFTCDVRTDVLKFMNAVSITAVFENLLSNAYEAALKSARKYIEISAIKYDEGQSVVISVINSCNEEPKKDFKGNYKTSKKSPLTHGYGIKSIVRVVNKYNGTNRFYYDQMMKQFHSVIQFPYDTDRI